MELTVSVDELRKHKVFIACPMYGGMCNGLFMKSCLDLQALLNHYGIENRFSFLFNESLITRARNYLADEFLRSGFTHLLFIDSDIHFDPNDVMTLLALDKDIIGGPYPKKAINWPNVKRAVQKNAKISSDGKSIEWSNIEPGDLENVAGDYVFNPIPGTKDFQVTEPLQVMEIGTGYMMIKKEVFDKFKEEYPHLRYKPDHAGQQNFDGSRYIHAYFDTVIDPDSHRYLSEDYSFCQYWRAVGGEVWICPWMKTGHLGTYQFVGNLPKVAELTGSL